MGVMRTCLAAASAALLLTALLPAQEAGAIRGTVTLERGGPLHHATVLIVQLSRSAETRPDGSFEFRQVPPGRYELIAHMHPLGDERRSVEVMAGATASLDFVLRLAPIHEEITVTASGREESTLDAFHSVLTVQGLDLAPRASASLGEALDHEVGVAKRSFGPGTSRPVVRGFDGDRVLVMHGGRIVGEITDLARATPEDIMHLAVG